MEQEERSLLLVDDEEGIRMVLGISLTDRGYQVHLAEDGRHALALFDAKQPEVVLTDIKMPGMDGIELLKAIKQKSPETEVIMITGHGDMDLAIQSLKHDATDYITKPIDDDILDLALQRAWERITMRKQLRHYTENLERLVEEKSRRLIEAERMAAVGETITGMAHAVKNIAGGLRGGAFIVENGLASGDDELVKNGWRMTQDNVVRIEELALDLLNIAKPDRLKTVLTDPAKPLQEVFRLMQPKTEQIGLTLNLHVENNLPQIPIDPEAIHRCLLNLVTNALDACCSIKENEPDAVVAPIELQCGKCPDGIEYSIRDHCGGMEESVREKVFLSFFTTKGSRGTGIGLMLTRKIVEAHQGTITVESQRGSGSTFTIRLPTTNITKNKPEKV